MLKLAREIIEITGSNSRVEYRELPEDDPKQREPSISRAKEILEWLPKVDRAEGLKLTIDYFKNVI
jgi:dTDP-glucose 4,6-dehydratase